MSPDSPLHAVSFNKDFFMDTILSNLPIIGSFYGHWKLVQLAGENAISADGMKLRARSTDDLYAQWVALTQAGNRIDYPSYKWSDSESSAPKRFKVIQTTIVRAKEGDFSIEFKDWMIDHGQQLIALTVIGLLLRAIFPLPGDYEPLPANAQRV